MAEQPEGVPWPESGILNGLAEYRQPPFAIYVHVPFCLRRCGYCDFNTYTVGFGPGAEPTTYHRSVIQEIDFAGRALRHSFAAESLRPASSVFFGGGTPSLLDPAQIAAILAALQQEFGLAADAEVTLEANPDTVDAERIAGFRQAGVTRLSLGMQSAVPKVLQTLDRTHRQQGVVTAIEAAKALGLQTSVDLIYGTPGESLADWEASLQAAIALAPSHISAYSLIVEAGTKMGRQVSTGRLPDIDPDQQAEKYEVADRTLRAAGYHWYEISNFARAEAAELGQPISMWKHASKHNLAYWQDWDWWGFGPGAHSHVHRHRWWNLKHPGRYAQKLAAGGSPAAKGEVLSAENHLVERVMLALRTRDGLTEAQLAELAPDLANLPQTLARLTAEGLCTANPPEWGGVHLTRAGRLLADYATRVLLEWE